MRPRLAAVAALALAAAGCASDPHYYGDSRYDHRYDPRYAPPGYAPVAYTDYGRVVAIDAERGPGHTSGGGAVAGAIIGGVLGHQVGSGRGNDVATAAGAVGGAVAGNEQFRDGREATFTQGSLEGLRVGDRVRVADNHVFRD